MRVISLLWAHITGVVWLLLLVVALNVINPDIGLAAWVLALTVLIMVWAWKGWPWVGHMIPGVHWYLRSQRLTGVAPPHRHASREQRAVIRRLSRAWPALMERWGLVVTTGQTLTGEDKTAWPVLRAWSEVPLGLRCIVRPVQGQDPAQVVGHADEMASAIGWPVRAAVLGPREVEVTIVMRDPLAGTRETAASTGALAPVVVGRLEDGTDATIDLRDATHTAIQGMTRTGKSVFTYGLLAQLAGVPEVRVMGVDPNAVLLAPWAERALPGDIALGSDADEALAVIDRAVALMDERLHDLPAQRLEKLEIFTPDSPVVLLVLEEYPALIRAAELADGGRKPAERVLPRIRAQVGRLVSEGAKAGIRVLLITQRADASILDGPTRAQMGTRITFAVDNRDAVTMLHPSAESETVDAVRGFPPGRALFWQHRRQQVMQSDFTPYDVYLSRVEGKHSDAHAA